MTAIIQQPQDALLDSTFTRWLQEEDEQTTDYERRMDLAASIVSSIFLFLLIFGLSATVDIRHLRQELRNKFALCTGVFMQFLIMPLLGFFSVLVLRNFGLTQAMGISLLVVTSSPGGSYSNWWVSVFNADLALSVAMTAVSTVLSIALLPANLFLYSILVYGVSKDQGVVQSLDLGAIFTSLGIVISAILSGLYASYKMHSKAFQTAANRLGSVCGICLILVSIFLSSSSEDANFWSQHWTFYVGTALPCCLGLLLANVACQFFSLRKPEQMAISIECCYQNVGIATSVAVTMFDDPVERAQALCVPLFYGLVEAVLICFYCIASWKMGWTKAPAQEKLCVVVTRTYEFGHDGDDSSQEESDDTTTPEEQETAPSHDTSNATAVQHLHGWRAWLAWPFIPRFPEELAVEDSNDENEQDDDLDVEMAVPTTPKCTPNDEERCRVVSEDYTAATTATGDLSSPDSPGQTFDADELLGLEVKQLPIEEDGI